MHGEAFDEGPRRAAYPMPGAGGGINFPITSKHPAAQAFFNQGVCQLHGFWYLEAERSFRQVAALDPGCAMAYWGMAMANVNNEKRAKAFAAEAAKRKQGVSPLEARWIDVTDAYYRADANDNKARAQAYLDALRQMLADFPDSAEVKAFFVVRTWEATRAGIPIADHEALDDILDAVFQAAPGHPAHHYRIHLWDDKQPDRALASAARCGQSAPGIAHLWHMPGHTYSKLHRYEDGAYHQEASARVDHAYMIRDRVMPYQIHNYAHNNEWCVRNLVYVGRVGDALDLARNMIELPRHPKHNLPSSGNSGAEMGRARLIDVLSLHEMWDEYLALSETPYLAEADDTPEGRVRRLRYLGVAHGAKGNADKALEQVAALEAMRAKLKVEGFAAAAKAEADARGRNEPAEKVAEARAKARRETDERLGDIERAVAHINAQQAAAAGDHTSAAELLGKADAPKPHVARALLKAGDKEKAEAAAREAVSGGENQAYPLAALVEVLHGCGKPAEAKEAFERLRRLSPRADLTRSVYARLAPLAAEFGYPADWRLPRELPADVGARPALDALGPFRWRPPPAPEWRAFSGDGSSVVSMQDYRGRPVVVIFYLGYRCLHCTQQLQAFAPLAQQYADAGISLVAVSTDPPQDLRRAMEAYASAGTAAGAGGSPGAFPFTLASDATLQSFRAYHAYDDFEQVPLHGTFLVDGEGLVRWQDVSHEPFTDAAFLLSEAKRLLAQPKG